MFGLVSADMRALTKAQRRRYHGVYCGICRSLHARCGPSARWVLSYDMAFLALLLTSLYEPEELEGKGACKLHPLRSWTDNPCIHYCAAMNLALAYYKALDDLSDEGHLGAKRIQKVLAPHMQTVRAEYPRQCEAMERSLAALREHEQAGCKNPDLPAGCFGALLGELFVFEEDMWAPTLRALGDALGRFIYLADAAMDYRRDGKKGQYNPFLAMGMGENRKQWEQYLLLEMGRCTECFERLPLVQDKAILDNILYSGIWMQVRSKHNERSL